MKLDNNPSDGSHILTHILPTILTKMLNSSLIIINLQWAHRSQFLTVGMGFASLFSFVCGYLLIISLNIGLTYQISRKRNDPVLIGIFYQRALLVNFLFCAFLITPLLYVSESVVDLFSSIITQFKEGKAAIGEYLYQLVPSIWAFAFYDTTSSFLQAQGRVIAPLLIQVAAVLVHLGLLEYAGPAWSKNFSDLFCSIAIYLYIVLLAKNLQSWIEWTIKCIKGWHKHIKFLQIIGLATYAHALFFFFFSLLAYKLRREELICHIYYINIYQMIYLSFIGVQQGCMSKIGFFIKENQYSIYKKVGLQSIKFAVGSCCLLVLGIVYYKKKIHTMFMYVYSDSNYSHISRVEVAESQVFHDNFQLLVLTLIVDSFFLSISSLLKALRKNHALLKMKILFYLLIYILCYVLCYQNKMGMKGLWLGWLLGSSLGSLWLGYKLWSSQLNEQKSLESKSEGF